MFNTQRSFFRPTYEDFQPLAETKETPESYLVLIYLPPGFARDHISAKFESFNRRVRVFGERPLVNNRRSRFNVVYPVPESCEPNKLQRKFEGGIVAITMPKKVIPKAISPKDQELVKLPTEQHASDHESKASGSRVEEGKISSNEVKGQKGISQEPKSKVDDEKKVGASIPPKAITGDSMAQKGKEVISQEPKSKDDEKKVEASIPPKAITGDSMAQKGKEAISQQPKSKVDDEKKVEASIPPKAITGDSVAQTGQEGVENKSELKMDKKIQTDEIEGLLKMDKKIQTDEIEGSVLENGGKQRTEKKETKEDIERREVKAPKGHGGENEKLAGSTSENGKSRGAEKKETNEVTGKTSEVIGNQKPSTTRVEETGKASSIGEANADGQKGQDGKNEKHAGSISENGKNKGAEKKETEEVIGKTSSCEVGKETPSPDVIDLLGGKESKKEERKECTQMERNGKFGNLEEGGSKGSKDITDYSKGKGIKEVAASASQAVTNMTKRINEIEDNKQMMIYMGAAAAAVLVTAVIGVCASTIRSFLRS